MHPWRIMSWLNSSCVDKRAFGRGVNKWAAARRHGGEPRSTWCGSVREKTASGALVNPPPEGFRECVHVWFFSNWKKRCVTMWITCYSVKLKTKKIELRFRCYRHSDGRWTGKSIKVDLTRNKLFFFLYLRVSAAICQKYQKRTLCAIKAKMCLHDEEEFHSDWLWFVTSM